MMTAVRLCLIGGAILLCGLPAGCSRKSSASGAKAAATTQPARALPTYSISPDLRAAHPAVAHFVEEFLEVCLANDYAGYRRLVSRRVEPETQLRFERIYQAIRSVTVESITPRTVRDLAGDVFVVVTSVEFDPAMEAKVKLREDSRRLAILVFREDDAWRMAPAPSKLQPPSDDEAPAAASSPAAQTQPVYPWDVDPDS